MWRLQAHRDQVGGTARPARIIDCPKGAQARDFVLDPVWQVSVLMDRQLEDLGAREVGRHLEMNRLQHRVSCEGPTRGASSSHARRSCELPPRLWSAWPMPCNMPPG